MFFFFLTKCGKIKKHFLALKFFESENEDILYTCFMDILCKSTLKHSHVDISLIVQN